jgi:hypothetical protein
MRRKILIKLADCPVIAFWQEHIPISHNGAEVSLDNFFNVQTVIDTNRN